MAFKVPERYRVKQGAMASDSGYGNNGAALPKAPRRKRGFIPSLSLNP